MTLYTASSPHLLFPHRVKTASLHRQLCDLSIGILGVGQIGKRGTNICSHQPTAMLSSWPTITTVAEMCKSLGMTVWGVTRTPPSQTHHPCPSLDHNW